MCTFWYFIFLSHMLDVVYIFDDHLLLVVLTHM